MGFVALWNPTINFDMPKGIQMCFVRVSLLPDGFREGQLAQQVLRI